jgi:hypothetical protein
MKPFPQIYFRLYWRDIDKELKQTPVTMATVAWLSAKRTKDQQVILNPKLAVSFDRRVLVYTLNWETHTSPGNVRENQNGYELVQVLKEAEWQAEDIIVHLEWIYHSVNSFF